MRNTTVRLTIALFFLCSVAPAFAAVNLEKLKEAMAQINSVNGDAKVLTALVSELTPLATAAAIEPRETSSATSFYYGACEELGSRFIENSKRWRGSAGSLSDKAARVAVLVSLQRVEAMVNERVSGSSSQFWKDRKTKLQDLIRQCIGSINEVIESYAGAEKSKFDLVEALLANFEPSDFEESFKARLEDVRGSISAAQKELETAIATRQQNIEQATLAWQEKIDGLTKEASATQGNLTQLQEQANAARAELKAIQDQTQKTTALLQAAKLKMDEVNGRIDKVMQIGTSGAITVNVAEANSGWPKPYQEAFATGFKKVIVKQLEDDFSRLEKNVGTYLKTAQDRTELDLPNIRVSLVYDKVTRTRRLGMLWTTGFRAVARVTIELTYQLQKQFVRFEIPLKSDGDVNKHFLKQLARHLETEVGPHMVLMMSRYVDCPKLLSQAAAGGPVLAPAEAN